MNAPHFRAGNPPDARPGAPDEISVEPQGEQTVGPFTLKALRIADEGWGADWALQPAPMRRGWMDAQPYSYQCPPLAVANQWGWQILCPTDVLVAWDGSPDPPGLRVRVDPRFTSAIKS